MTKDAPQFNPNDDYTAKLFQEHNLGTGATLDEIEPVATELLKNIRTALTGAELILGHHTSSRDEHVAPILYTPGLSPEDKFALLLMEKETEKNIAAAIAKING